MENHQPLLFTSPTQLMGSISHDGRNHGFDFDLSCIPNYGHDFDEFMFANSGFLDNTLISCHETAFNAKLRAEGTPDFNLSHDGDARLNEAVEGYRENGGDGNSSGTMMPRSTKTKRDHFKTLVSERRRRGRMKEKLYELRSLVPNITKMDKASIVADAVVYVSNLQEQAKKLVEEIAMLESSSTYDDQVFQEPLENTMVPHVEERKSPPIRGMVMQVMVHGVGEGRFYMKAECNKGDGIAPSLYVAMESLVCFDLECSNFSMDSDRYVWTLTMSVRGYGEEMSASTVKLWVMGALRREGFELEMITP